MTKQEKKMLERFNDNFGDTLSGELESFLLQEVRKAEKRGREEERDRMLEFFKPYEKKKWEKIYKETNQ